MGKFKNYLQDRESIDEGIFSSILNMVKSGIKYITKKIVSAINSLKFGSNVTIDINYIKESFNEDTGNIDLKSRMGYYSELTTSAELVRELRSRKYKVRTSPAEIIKIRDTYKKTHILNEPGFSDSDKKKLPDELARMQASGEAMALKMVEDLEESGHDLAFCEFEVVAVGETMKFTSKADVQLIVYKKGTKEVIDEINASLKAYKSFNVNISNSTFVSWIKNLLDPDISGTGDKYIENFVKKYKKYAKKFVRAKSLADMFRNVKRDAKKSGAKDYAKIATDHMNNEKAYIHIRDFMVLVFNDLYRGKNKKIINERMLELLGLNGADDIYLAVANKKGISVISSRTSEEFADLYEKLKNDFEIEIIAPKNRPTSQIILKSKKTEILKLDMAYNIRFNGK